MCVCVWLNNRLKCGDSVTNNVLRSAALFSTKGERTTPLTLQLALRPDVNYGDKRVAKVDDPTTKTQRGWRGNIFWKGREYKSTQWILAVHTMTWVFHTQTYSLKRSMGSLLFSLLNTSSGMTIRHGVLLCKQYLRPMTDYACPIRRAAARSHFRKLRVPQSKYLRIATGAPWYIGNRQIHDDMGVPFFADHFRSLTKRFGTKLVGVGVTWV